MAIYEGKWRCRHCSTVNPGRSLNCASCGVKRDKAVEFFLDADAPAVEEDGLLNAANAGANWICRYCGGGNGALDVQCSSCGNRRSDADEQMVEETRASAADWAEKSRQTKQAPETANLSGNEAVDGDEKRPPRAAAANPLIRFGLYVAVAGAVAVAGLLIYLSSLTYPFDVEVVNLEWSRSIAIEEYRTLSETGWEGYLPSDARIVSQSRALHHTDHVPSGSHTIPETYTEREAAGTERYKCGTINKKNGFFADKYCTRTKYRTVTKSRNRTVTDYTDVPVYRTRYNYQIDRWISAGEETTAGENFNPQWAAVVVDNVRRRESGRTENYKLICQASGGKLHKINLSGDRWRNFTAGQKLHGRISWFGNLISVEELPDNEW